MTYERTIYEAVLDARYEVRFQELQAKLFARANLFCTWLALLSTSTAFAGTLNKNQALTTAAGAVITALGFLSILVDFQARRCAHEAQRKRYLELVANASGMTLEAIDAELARLAIDDPPAIESLKMKAFNDNLLSNGRDEAVKPLSRFARALAVFVG